MSKYLNVMKSVFSGEKILFRVDNVFYSDVVSYYLQDVKTQKVVKLHGKTGKIASQYLGARTGISVDYTTCMVDEKKFYKIIYQKETA